MRCFYFVDNDGTENVSNFMPSRHSEGFWVCEQAVQKGNSIITVDMITELPKGTIYKLFGIELTWKDNPIMMDNL